MSSRLLGWAAAVLVILITLALIIGEITDAAQRSWWGAHSLTTDTVSGMLVLLITVLVVNQLLNMRQDRQRGQAVAAEAAIIEAQAGRAAKAVSSVIDGSGDRGAASDTFRTYMVMLLIGAPVLIDDPVARNFLERAQYLGGVMTRTLAIMRQVAARRCRTERRAGRRRATDPKCRGTASPAAESQGARFHAAHRLDRQRVVRAGPVISAVPGWRDGFVVGETHVLSAYQGQGLGRSLITALLHPAPDAICAVLCEARKPYGHFRRPFDQGNDRPTGCLGS